MAGGHKFGTFGGVFTPSVLTILGVIMYLRLPWVVGQGGLWIALAVILVSHVISVTTGLSVASIATDKKVKAGGPYYIVSRSLGLPLGGTLGLALFTGLSFSVSLYVIGFSESFLDYLGVEQSIDNIRICGSLTLVVLAIITLISTALAIKLQYFILTAIVLSLVSIFFGSPPEPSESVHLEPLDGGASIAVLFGIFFPAVTGFTAGVNMSGDLEDPKRAIPLGTILSIATGLVVYVGLAVFLAVRIPGEQLSSNKTILIDMALFAPFVIAGIWGATLSSALGSILGAPRILQALSLDRITPKVFGRGHGKHNEPRNALILALLIGEAGILIGSLDAIAAIVSMFFIATYGFLNISAAVEAWASPDFRPDFRIPKFVSLLGAVTCVLVMIQLNFLAMVGSVVLLGTLFLYLKRRELTLEAGDTWVGIWSSIVRAGLHRLRQGYRHHRNWRPNVLLFERTSAGALREDGPPTAEEDPMLALGESLISRGGVLTRFELVEGDRTKGRRRGVVLTRQGGEAHEQVGVFHRQLPSDEVYDTMAAVCRYHGFSGVEPNTVLLDWWNHRDDPLRFGALLNSLEELDLNIVLLARDAEMGFGDHERIDIWWSAEAGNVQLSLALLRYITTSDEWRRASLRFLLISEDAGDAEGFHKVMRRLLDEARVEATVKIVHNALEGRPLIEWVRQESHDAALTVVGLHGRAEIDPVTPEGRDYFEALDGLTGDVGSVLFVRGSAMFGEVLGTRRAEAGRPLSKPFGAVVDGDLGALALPAVSLPEDEALGLEAHRFRRVTDRLLGDLYDRALGPAYAGSAAVLAGLDQTVRKFFDQLDLEALAGRADAKARARFRKTLTRAQATLLFQSQKHLTEHVEGEIAALQERVEEQLASWSAEVEAFRLAAPERLEIEPERSAFDPDPDDPPEVERFKSRRRLLATLRRKAPSYPVEVRRLLRYYLDDRALTLVHDALAEAARHGYHQALELGKVLNALRAALTMLRRRLAAAELAPEVLRTERDRILGQLEALAVENRELGELHQRSLLAFGRGLAQDFADDLGRVEIAWITQRDRRVGKAAVAKRAALDEAGEGVRHNQAHLVRRAGLAVVVAAFEHRAATIVGRHRQAVVQRLTSGLLREYDRLLASLFELREGLDLERSEGPFEAPEVPKLSAELRAGFDAGRAIEDLARELQSATRELPEEFETLSDEGIQHLSEAEFEPGEVTQLPVRRVVDFLMDAELTGALRPAFADIPATEQRAVGVAQDVLRLIGFNLGDFDLGAPGEVDREAFVEQLRPVLDNGISRVEAERDKLAALAPNLEERMEERLDLVFTKLDAFAATGSVDPLKQYLRGAERPTAVRTRFEAATESVSNALKKGAVALLYRKSAVGSLMAQRESPEEAWVDHVLALVDRCAPKPEVLDALPFFYHQLFLGKTAIDKSFWVGRTAELAEARRAIEHYRAGYRGALIVSGDHESGKSALLQLIASRHFPQERIHQLRPPRGGSIDLDDLRRAFATALGGGTGTPEELLRTAPEGSCLVIDDLEMWFERAPGGLAAIDELWRLIDRFSPRILFIAGLSTPALHFISRYRQLADKAVGVVECRPMSARALKQIIDLRHRSTGLGLRIEGRREDELADWRVARVFTALHEYSGGLVGAALRAWAAHVDRVEGDKLHLRRPKVPSLDVLDELRMEWIAVLLELVVHKQVSFERLVRLTDLDPVAADETLHTLRRMGLVTIDRQHVIELNRFTSHLVIRHLRDRGLVP